MKILVISYHCINDNRIRKHINSICKFSEVEYLNVNKSIIREHAINKACSIHNIPIAISKKNIIGIFEAYFRVKKFIKMSKAEIVHIHDPLLLCVLKTAKKKKMYTVYDKHESYEVCGGLIGKVAPLLDKIYNKYLDSIIYVNTAQKKYLEKFSPRLVLIPNYQSLNDYKRKSLKLNSEDIVIVYFGLLSRNSRDVPLMLNVIESVVAKRETVTCLIGGEINDPDDKDRILSISKKYNNFKYMGYLPYKEVISITNHADIGLYFQKDKPNNRGSSPNKIFEYLISGLAIVSVGRYEYWDIVDNNAGKAFDYNITREKIEEYIFSLIDNPELLSNYKKESLKIGEKFTWESIENRYEKLYRELLFL